MSSIDNRIVILTFDNKNFEKNVQTSMSTLDKLKNSLKFDGATRGLDKLSTSAKAVNLNPIGAAIESIRSRFTNLGIVGMTVLQNLTNTAVDFGKRIIGAVVTPLTAGGWKRALNIEQATFQMEGLIGKTENGAEKIKAIMESVKTSVQGTAYGMDEAARVASQLVATGVEDAQQMLKYLQGVAGAAAMTGGSYDEIGHIFTTVAGQGRLMGEQLNQFAYRGLNIAATLSKQMNITEAEFRDLVSKGKISFDMFAEGLAEAFGEHATKANETFTGSLQNMKAALARIGEEFSSPALKYFRDIFYSLKLLIDQVHERLKPLINLINDQLIGNAAKLVDFIDSITEALGGESQRMKNAAKETAETTEEAAERISKSTEEIDEAAKRVLSGEFGNGEERRRQLEELGYSYERVQNKVNELLGSSYRYEVTEEEIADAAKDAAKETEEFSKKAKILTANQYYASQIFQNLKFSLVNIKNELSRYGKAFKQALINSFSNNHFIVDIRNITSAFKTFTQRLNLNRTELTGLQKIWEAVFNVLSKGLHFVFKGVEYFIKFGTVIADLRKKFLGFIGSMYDANGEIDKTTKRGKFFAAFGDVIDRIGESFKTFKTRLGEVWDRVKNTGGFMKLRDTFQQLWTNLKELGGKIFDDVLKKMEKFAGTEFKFGWLDKLVPMLGKAAGHIGTFVGWIADGIPKIDDFFRAFKDSETGKYGGFVDFLIRAKDAVVEFFKGVDSETGELNLFGKLREAISNAMSNLGEFFSGLDATKFAEGFKSFIKKVTTYLNEPEVQEALGLLKRVGLLLGEFLLLYETITAFRSIKKAFGSIGDLFESLSNRFGTKKLFELSTFGKLVVGLGAAVAAIWVISKIPVEDLKKSVIGISVVMGEMLGIFLIVSKIPTDDAKMKSFAASMAGLGIGLLAIAGAAKILSSMAWGDILDSAGKVALFAGIMAIAARLAGNVQSGATFLGLAVALNLLLIPITVLGHMKRSVIKKAAEAIGFFAIELGLAARLAGSVKAAAAFMGLAVALNLLVPAVAILGHFEWSTIKKGATAIGFIVAELAIACRIASSENAGKGAGAILALAVAIGVAAYSLKVLGEMDAEGLKRGAIALGVVVGEMAVVLGLSKGLTMGSAVSMLAVVGTIVAAMIALKVLAEIPWEQLKSGTISMGLVMTAAGKAVRAASEGNFADKMGGVLAMALTMAAAVVALKFLATTPWEQLLGGAAALSMLIISVGGALKLMSDSNLGFVGAIKNAAALGLSIDIIVGLVGGFVLGVGKLSEVLRDKKIMDMEKTLQEGGEVLKSLGTAIGNFVGSIIASFGESATSTLPEIGQNLSDFAASLDGFFSKIKEYGSDTFSGVSNFAKALLEITGAELLDRITHPFVGGSSLEDFGKELVIFAAYFGNFAEQVSDISYSDITKMHGIAGAVEVLAKAAQEIPNQETDEHWNLLSLIFGDNDIGLFGQELGEFMGGFETFCEKLGEIEEIDSEKISAVAGAVQVLAEAAQEIPNQETDKHWNLLSLIFGDNDIGTFGQELATFAGSFSEFTTELAKIDDIDSDKISAVAKAVSEFGEAADNIPNQITDGKWNLSSFLFGDNKLSDFGSQLEAFISPFGTFVTDLGEMGDINFEQLSNVASVISELGLAAQNLPTDKDGSIFGKIFGTDTELDEFGRQLEQFGKHFSQFSKDISGLSTYKTNNVTTIVNTLSDLADHLTSVSIGNLTSFGTNLGNFSASLPTFIESVNEINTEKINGFAGAITELVNSLVNVAGDDVSGALDTLATILGGTATSSVEEFNSGIAESAGTMAEAVGSAFSTVAAQLNSLSGMADLLKAMTTAGEDAVDAFKDAINDNREKAYNAVNVFAKRAQAGLPSDFGNKFRTTAMSAVAYFNGAISSGNKAAYDAGAGLASAAYNGLAQNVNHGAWYQVGANCASGLVQGLGNSAALRAAAEAAANLVRTAKRAAEAEGQIKSPSRVFYRIGNYMVEGLVLAMNDGIRDVSTAGTEIAAAAVNSAKQQMKLIQDVVTMDTDLNPVITPVVDLSNVQAGANQIGSIFGGSQYGLNLGNNLMLNRLASMTTTYTDPGNKDVVDAINGLKGKTNSYTFNVTVDGTENPEEFASRLVNAIKMRSRI